ncbi:NHS-like protein 1 isoform X2 [Silurus meridionalis]|uniref:NHS-like protein 1 isoform X2 n=1 Tax=Silurus meridionalis TaxID=175797 RepID=UPI001EEA987A|nr:NHS-like protein 1 isoform X2 [Silurus meridionalis]
MMAYVNCISPQLAGKCWNRVYYEDEDELLPIYIHKPNNLQSQNGGSLRRRLLVSKIHERQDRLWYSRHWDGPSLFTSIQPLQTQHRSTFKPMQEDCTAVSSLDEESKWTVHYTAPWHQQENVFLPGSRPPCVEELHCQAKVNLKTVLRECDKLQKDGFCDSQYYSQGPTFSSPLLTDSDGKLDQVEIEKKKKRSRILDCLPEYCLSFCYQLKPCRKKSSETSAEEEKLVYSFRPQTPLLNTISDINNHNSWSKCLPLPTPEEKMRQEAQSVTTDIVPINITGENFDRQASFRRTIINTDTIIRRSKRVKRRKTITGVPDNIKRELANNEQTENRSQSIYTTDQYSTLGSIKHLVTCESGCQTDDIKNAPPSMRRIRSQKGHGITTQMANMSLSSSGSIPNMSDCNDAVSTHQLNASLQGFHSLPRQGARICLQKLEANCSSSPYLAVSGSTSSLPYQVTRQNVSPDSQHMSDFRKNTYVSSRSDEFHAFQNKSHNAASGYMDSIHSSSTSSLNAGIVLQDSRNHSSVHSSQSFDPEEAPLYPIPTCPSEQPFSSSETSCSASSSCCQSPAFLHMATETQCQCSMLDGRNCSSSSVCEDSDIPEGSIPSCSTLTTDHWKYKPASVDQCTSSCSSNSSNVCNSLEHSPRKTDSWFSVYNEGFYSSIHLVPEYKSYSHGCINKAEDAGQNLYECKEHHSHEDRVSLHSNHSVTRSISLRKTKKPPLPPRRTDSLQRKPQQKTNHNEKVLNEQLISSLNESLKSHSASFSGQMSFSGLEDPWGLGLRSQSSVSVASSGMSAPAAVCPTTPTHSDSSSQHSEYTESWDFYMDFPRSCSDHGQSFQITRPVLTKENSEGLDHNLIPSTACNKTGKKSKVSASPDKVQLLTSPSSGYSSQSITPTAGTPVTSLMRVKSPSGRPKPKVPERKSSLRSSVSPYSTSLSSNSSESVRSLPTPPPLPQILPGLVIPQSSSAITMPSLIKTSVSPIMPLSSPLSMSSLPEPSTIPEKCQTFISSSSNSPSPTSEASSLMLIENKMSHPQLPPPPPPPISSNIHTQSFTPPLPGTGFQTVTILKATNSPIVLDTTKKVNELPTNSRQSDRPAGNDRPVISAQALQRVQLRPIKLMKLENIFTDIITTVCGSENQDHNKMPRTSTDKPVETEVDQNCIVPDSVCPLQNGKDTKDLSSKETTPTKLVHNTTVLPKPVSSTNSSENTLESPRGSGPLSTSPASSSVLQSTTSCASIGTLHDQRSSISPEKKSNHSLIMPSILHQSASNGLVQLEVTDSTMSLVPETLHSTSLADAVNQYENQLHLEFDVKSDSQHSTSVSPQRHSLSSEISTDSLIDPQLTSLTLDDQDNGLCDSDIGLSDKGIADDSLSSSSGSVNFKEEDNYENDAVFDSGTDSSSPTFSSTGEDIDEMSPTCPRTTDDLFAAIHRSKRKVLGRCDSEEERSRGFISPPVTPTSFSPSIARMQNSYSQRRLRRSNTSNDSFKALLLKKGSRSEPGFRMSATEMLKCTDPRLQRSNAEAPSPFSTQCTSPGRSRKASEEWARTEGALPRFSPSLSHSKYGRSSTPPCAASSRYNSRSRIPSGPMTVICEKEGEVTESVDCCNIPFPVSLSSSGTVCAQGST